MISSATTFYSIWIIGRDLKTETRVAAAIRKMSIVGIQAVDEVLIFFFHHPALDFQGRG